MADLTDILAGAFGGAANPNDPFGYQRIQLGRQEAAENQRRGALLAGELALRQQMQPYSISDLLAGIEQKKAETARSKAAADAQEEANKEAQYQWDKSGRPFADWLGGIASKLGVKAAGTAAALGSDPLAQIKLNDPTFDESGPAALLGLPIPPGRDTSLEDMLKRRAMQQAYVSAFGVNPATQQDGLSSSTEVAIKPGMTASQIMEAASANDKKGLAALLARNVHDEDVRRQSLSSDISKLLAGPGVAGSPTLQSAITEHIDQLLNKDWKPNLPPEMAGGVFDQEIPWLDGLFGIKQSHRGPMVLRDAVRKAPTVENIGSLSLDDLLDLRTFITTNTELPAHLK